MLAAAPRASQQANQWSRRGKVPLDLTGCPADLGQARVWVMKQVFGVELYSWQKRALRSLGARTRAFRRAYVQVARKNGKSLLACALILTELVLVEESHVYAVADSEKNLQSAMFRELRTLIARSPDADRAFIVTRSQIEYPHNGSFLEVRPNNFGATQAINPTLVVMDEVHLQKTDEVWHGFNLAGAASGRFLLLGITTPGYDVASFAHELYIRAKEGEEGLFTDIHEPSDPACSSGDRRAWLEANPRLEDDQDFLPMLIDDHRSLPEHEFRRFRLGQWTTTQTAWLPYGAWDKLAVELSPADQIQDFSGGPLWLGFDGSYSGDSTALYGWTRRPDGRLHGFVAGVWENPGHTDWRVPRDEVDDCVTRWMSATRHAVLLADPPYWGREVSEWAARGPGRVLEFPTHSRARMAPACTTFYSGVLNEAFTHDGDVRMARHLANCVVRPSPQGDFITKAQKNSPAKIDLAVAAVIGYSVASQAQRQRSPAGVF
jgi:phage terminase large subunit-like protein